MTGMSPWLGRLILLLALITIDHASPALAVTLVIGAAVAATAYLSLSRFISAEVRHGYSGSAFQQDQSATGL